VSYVPASHERNGRVKFRHLTTALGLALAFALAFSSPAGAASLADVDSLDPGYFYHQYD
jgi:hypothetical protein